METCETCKYDGTISEGRCVYGCSKGDSSCIFQPEEGPRLLSKWEPKEDRDNEVPPEKPWSEAWTVALCHSCRQYDPQSRVGCRWGWPIEQWRCSFWGDQKSCDSCAHTAGVVCNLRMAEGLQACVDYSAWKSWMKNEDDSAETGLKHDDGKLRLDLVPPEAIEMLGRIYTHGAAKYGEGNWEHGFRPGQLLAAARRHDMDMAKGEWLDPETGIPHAFHAAWNYTTIGVLESRTKEKTAGPK